MMGDEHKSEELFQEVFLAVWKHRRQYDASRPFRPWLYQIAVNRCRAAFRRAHTPTVRVDDQPALPEPHALPPLESVIATETSVQVTAAVQLLPDKQRLVVVLRIWHNLSYAEIGDIAGCSEVTARSHMHLALQTLRERLTI